jgi:hypothetical protein
MRIKQHKILSSLHHPLILFIIKCFKYLEYNCEFQWVLLIQLLNLGKNRNFRALKLIVKYTKVIVGISVFF